MTESENCYCSVVVSCSCEKQVAEAGDSSRTQRKRNVPSLEDATEQQLVKMRLWTLVCVILKCEM
jgi:hypothetical protein